MNKRIDSFLAELHELLKQRPFSTKSYNELLNRYNNPVKIVKRTSPLQLVEKFVYYFIVKRMFKIDFIKTYQDDYELSVAFDRGKEKFFQNHAKRISYYKVLFMLLTNKFTQVQVYVNTAYQLIKKNNISVACDFTAKLPKDEALFFEEDYIFLDMCSLMINDMYPDESLTKFIIV